MTLYSEEKVFLLIDSAPGQVHSVSSAKTQKEQTKHAILDAIDYGALIMIERPPISS